MKFPALSQEFWTIAPRVAENLHAGAGLVALESTLVAQGLPWPENLETARAAEASVEQAGAMPATIAVVGGRVVVGLDAAGLEDLARSGRFAKANRRDLATAVARGTDAATTVAATLWIARAVGIGVMATGGLGGVHRDAGRSFDVSNDLDELAHSDGSVLVCSGVKSILDVPATLESLETRGVLVVGYRTDHLPGFTVRSSGLPLEVRVETPDEAAALARTHRRLGLPGALVIGQEVPAAVALGREESETVLAKALDEARSQGIVGKALTPFLLGRIREATGGRSLVANRALIVANAGLAGEIARVLAAGVPRRD